MGIFVKENNEWKEVSGNTDIKQDGNGITVGETALQDATTTQDGLMTKEQVTALNGKATTGSVQTAQSKADSAYNLANGKLGKTENAVSATKATNDGSNRNIVNTYATKSELNGKASTSSLNALANRVTALENIPNANGRSY